MDLREKVERLTSIYSRLGNSDISHIDDYLCFTGFFGVSLYNLGYIDSSLGRQYFLSTRASDIDKISGIHIILKDFVMKNDMFIYADEGIPIKFSDFDPPLEFFYNQEDYYESMFVKHK